MASNYNTRGVKTKLLGFVLVVLGTLDVLLTLRGGVPDYKFFILILVGICVFAVGTVRGATQRPSEDD